MTREMNNMTNTNKWIKLCEAAGYKFDWTNAGCHVTYPDGHRAGWLAWLDNRQEVLEDVQAPRYLTDHSALMELVRKLEGDDRSLFIDHLHLQTSLPEGAKLADVIAETTWVLVTSGMDKLVEAYARVKNLWPEENAKS